MPTNISIEKIKELIRLPSAPRRSHGLRLRSATRRSRRRRRSDAGWDATEPQPEADWRDAFIRYVEDLPEEALDEIVSLYRTGGGGGVRAKTWRRVRRAPMPPISTGLSS